MVKTPAISEPVRAERDSGSAKRRRWWATRQFLLISIVVHFLFGLGAAYVVVSRYSAARKLTFQAGPKSPNATERAIQHRVQLKEKTKSAPAAIPKRVISAAPSKVELPPLPS